MAQMVKAVAWGLLVALVAGYATVLVVGLAALLPLVAGVPAGAIPRWTAAPALLIEVAVPAYCGIRACWRRWPH